MSSNPEPPPLRWDVVRRDARGSLRVDFRLSNRREVARWFVLRADLSEALQPRLSAHLLQLCGFEEEGVNYLQALGQQGGLLAFRLAPGASVEVRGFAFRAHGAPGLEVWEAASMRAAGRAVEDCFEADLEIAGEASVGGQGRATRATFPEKGLDVELEVVARWEDLPLGL